MARIAKRSTTPIATGERLIAAYSCRELVELGVVSFRLISITGGITALWKAAAWPASWITMAPHARGHRRAGDTVWMPRCQILVRNGSGSSRG